MRLQELAKSVEWVRPNESVLKADFNEYKKKESSKWERRAQTLGARFPIFDSLDQFSDAIAAAKIITLSSSDWNSIQNLSQTNSIEELEDLVSGYHQPRDVGRIAKGIENGDEIPLPIVIKGSKGRWIMAGNTRLNVARIMKVPQKALEVDVT